MKTEIARIIYIFDAPDSLMNKVRANTDCWADGKSNLCLSFEEALTVNELQEYIKNIDGFGCDVIVCS